MTEQIRISLQIYDDDDPVLHAYLRTLPTHKLRRRAKLLRLLRLGVEAERSGACLMQIPSSEARPAVAAAPAPLPSRPEQDQQDLVIDPDDLAAIFSS